MKDFRFQQNLRVIPLISPVDITETATASPYVDLGQCHWATFVCFFGSITGDSVDVTVQASTAASSNATEEAVGFQYRKSPAVATDTDPLGAVTAATSDGVSMTASDDDKILFVEINPAAVRSAKGDDYRYVRVVVTPATSAVSACELSVMAVLENRFVQTSIASSTY